MGSFADIGYLAGQRVGGKYLLISEIGTGGMGTVWVAKNDTTDAEVALKIWRPIDDDADNTRARFRNEAKLSAMLTHRNVVRVFDMITEDNGALILVMERLHGCSLASYLRVHSKVDVRAALGIACGVLAALEQAHNAGIVHRDVKPANIFLAVEPDGHVVPKLLDFGIAKVPSSNTTLTQDGRALGTPRYMSPEQIRGKEVDGRSDLFSLATVLYEALSGISPFDGETAAAALAMVLEVPPDPDPSIDPQLFATMSRSLSKRAYERPASATEFSQMLRSAAPFTDADLDTALRALKPSTLTEGGPAHSGSASSSIDHRPRKTRTPLFAAIAVAGLLVLGLATVMVVRARASETQATRPPRPIASETSSTAARRVDQTQASNVTAPSATLATQTQVTQGSPTFEEAPHRASPKTPPPPPPPVRKRPIATTPGF